jgi:ComF family protein
MISEPLAKLADSALNAVFPADIYCICCGDVLDGSRKDGLCDACAAKLPWAFDNPFETDMEEFAFDDVWPCVRYGFHARRIMNGLKNGGKAYMAKNVASMLAERVQLEWQMPDAFAAVPSHRDKLRQRGYNQAELLAKETARLLKLPHWDGLLEKVKSTWSLRMASGQERRSMLADSFAVSGAYRKALAGRFICLVDDVTTTGSTADACARVLKAAGASRVALLCFGASSGYKKSPEADAEEENR